MNRFSGHCGLLRCSAGRFDSEMVSFLVTHSDWRGYPPEIDAGSAIRVPLRCGEERSIPLSIVTERSRVMEKDATIEQKGAA